MAGMNNYVKKLYEQKPEELKTLREAGSKAFVQAKLHSQVSMPHLDKSRAWFRSRPYRFTRRWGTKPRGRYSMRKVVSLSQFGLESRLIRGTGPHKKMTRDIEVKSS